VIGAILAMALAAFFGGGTGHSAKANELPKPDVELPADRDIKPGQSHEAIFAGGCFWCLDGVFRQLKGVKDVTSGYAGGSKETAEYETVCSGTTGHAEAIRIKYDPSVITYGQLLRVFFTVHDPTTKNRQGPDKGTQYRSTVFYLDDEQKNVAKSYIKQLDKTGIFPSPIVTTLEAIKADTFYPAEDYHQNYVSCHLNNPYVRFHAMPIVEKAREAFKDQLKPEATTQP
jgi:peptide-methionine (S)-S-oxide reductase